MNKWKIMLVPILGLAVSGAFSADPPPVPQKAWRGQAVKSAAAETFKPVFSGNSIVCGNKTVQWFPDGRIRIGNSNGELLLIYPHHCYMDGRKKVDWSSFHKRHNDSQIRRQNNPSAVTFPLLLHPQPRNLPLPNLCHKIIAGLVGVDAVQAH